MIDQRENICHGLFVLANNHASRGDSCPGNGFEFQLANAVRCCSQDGTECITPECMATRSFEIAKKESERIYFLMGKSSKQNITINHNH